MLDTLIAKFDRIGARLTTVHRPRLQKPFDLDVIRDTKGEHFLLAVRESNRPFHVLQANQAARHLLLHTPSDAAEGGERFLCGHDERHWFVAAIKDRVTTITDAKRSLLPMVLRNAGLTPDELARRHTKAFKRQGEWFFVPTDKDLSDKTILHGEPIQRGRNSKPHMVTELIRFGGTLVVLSGGTEYAPDEFEAAVRLNPELRQRRAQRMVKDAEVYVRGKVRHRDHETLVLEGWHRVYMNAEVFSENMSFYD